MRLSLLFGLAGLAIGCAGSQTLTLDERSRVIEAPYDVVYEAAVLGLGANGLTVTLANREAGMLTVGTWEEGLNGGAQVGASYLIVPVDGTHTRVVVEAPEAQAGLRMGPDRSPLTVDQARALHLDTLDDIVELALRLKARGGAAATGSQ